MKKNMLFILLVLFVVIVWAALMFMDYKDTQKKSVSEQKPAVVGSFEECAQAGNPIMESYPRQCKTPDGKTFVENIGNELEKQDLIKVDSPRPNESVKSPLVITGEARGNWFFEASFPVKIVDANGKQLGIAVAQAKSDWMTENFVLFEATLEFSAPTTKNGFIILEKDNPSGLPQNADELKIPVNFDVVAQRAVELYYYNSSKDKDDSGNVMCSKQGLAAVQRRMPVTVTPIQDAIKLLLQGELSNEERASGIETEFPLPGVELQGASLNDGVLTLAFADPNNKTSGGSCRAGILWDQIEATAKQFPEVKSVKFIPEDIFQP